LAINLKFPRALFFYQILMYDFREPLHNSCGPPLDSCPCAASSFSMQIPLFGVCRRVRELSPVFLARLMGPRDLPPTALRIGFPEVPPTPRHSPGHRNFTPVFSSRLGRCGFRCRRVSFSGSCAKFEAEACPWP